MLEDSSGREAGGGSYDPGEDLRAFFMRRGDMGAKAWSKATAEQRAKHRASCIEAGRERKLQNFAAKHLDFIMEVSRIKERYGIEPREMMRFFLMAKDHIPLTEDQVQQW